MVSVNWTIYVQIANFLILIFILNFVLYKPIRSIMQQRKARFEGLAESISSSSKEAEEKDQAFSEGIKSARSKGQKQKESLMQAAAEEERTIVADINARAKADLDAVKAQIAKEAGSVRQELEKEIDLFADTITQKILGRAA
jgi:F-type H+-transporting ATPase subunit b